MSLMRNGTIKIGLIIYRAHGWRLWSSGGQFIIDRGFFDCIKSLTAFRL